MKQPLITLAVFLMAYAVAGAVYLSKRDDCAKRGTVLVSTGCGYTCVPRSP